jgi:hypothetical protein
MKDLLKNFLITVMFFNISFSQTKLPAEAISKIDSLFSKYTNSPGYAVGNF